MTEIEQIVDLIKTGFIPVERLADWSPILEAINQVRQEEYERGWQERVGGKHGT